jgi:hypothetical protein
MLAEKKTTLISVNIITRLNDDTWFVYKKLDDNATIYAYKARMKMVQLVNSRNNVSH